MPPPVQPQPAPPRPAPAAPTRVPEASGRGIGFLPIVAVIAVLLLAWLFLRRRSQSYVTETSSGLPDFPPVDAQDEDTVSENDLALPEVDAIVEFADDDADLPARAGESAPADTGGISVPPAVPETAQPAPLSGAEPAQQAFPNLGAAPVAAAVAGDGGIERTLQEIERRLRHIETRVEEIADSRERTDRAIAAHTEELRVQRSAIARAQRVLRNLTRPDEASEPVPKGPGDGS
jgi:hypothetical protein